MESHDSLAWAAIRRLKNPRVYYDRNYEGYVSDVEVDGVWIRAIVSEHEADIGDMSPETAYQEARERLFAKLCDHYKAKFLVAEESKLGLGYAGPVLR